MSDCLSIQLGGIAPKVGAVSVQVGNLWRAEQEEKVRVPGTVRYGRRPSTVPPHPPPPSPLLFLARNDTVSCVHSLLARLGPFGAREPRAAPHADEPAARLGDGAQRPRRAAQRAASPLRAIRAAGKTHR